MKTRFLAIGAASFLLAAPAVSQPDGGIRRSLDSLFSVNYGTDGPGGSALVMLRDSTIYQRSFGYADLQTREPFTPRTVSNLGSISKTFVAYGILLLRDEGRLSLDDDILKYFPDFKNKEIARKVKIRHLLTHTSGLPDSRPVDRDSV